MEVVLAYHSMTTYGQCTSDDGKIDHGIDSECTIGVVLEGVPWFRCIARKHPFRRLHSARASRVPNGSRP